MTYGIVREDFGPKYSDVAVGRLVIGQGVVGHIGNIVRTDERDVSVLSGGKNAV
jgi:hypothetical protein